MVEVKRVVQVTCIVGDGTDTDPVRRVAYFYDTKGNMIAFVDSTQTVLQESITENPL